MSRRTPVRLAAACLAASLLAAAGGATAQAQTLPVLSIDDPTVTEGTATVPPGPEAVAIFTITLSAPPTSVVTVNYTTVTFTAAAPNDFTSTSGTLTFAIGETSKTVSVPIRGDNSDENNEIFRLQLNSPSGATAPDATGDATIIDDDDPPTVSISDGVIQGAGTEGTGGTGTTRLMIFTLSLSAVSGKNITVNLRTVAGNATEANVTPMPAGADYLRFNESLTIPANNPSRTVNITINSDNADEVNETFELLVEGLDPLVASPGDTTGIGTIIDDDGPAISVSDATVTEGAAGQTTQAVFTVSLNATSPQDVSVAYATADDGARAGEDYLAIAAGQRVTIPAGSLLATVPVTVRGDDVDELDEKLRLNLSSPANGTLTPGDPQGVATITDDDATPGIGAADLRMTEGTGGAAAATLTVTLSAPSGRLLLAAYTTEDGTAVAGQDYQQTTEIITFNAGETQKEIAIPVAPDALVEEDETFKVQLINTAEGGNATVPVTVTIADDDLTPAGTPGLTIADASVPREGHVGATDAVFRVRMDRPLTRRVTVRYASVPGSATPGRDYTPVEGTLTFAIGETLHTIAVAVAGDRHVEGNEDFRIELSDPVNARLINASGRGTVVDDDAGLTSVSLSPSKVKASSLLCRRRRACTGSLVRWAATVPGTVAVEVTALLPAAGKSKKPRLLRLAKRTFKAKTGEGRGRVKRSAGRTASRLLRRVKGAKINRIRVDVTFTNRRGGRQVERFAHPLS